MGSCQTVPVNESADPRRVGTDPDGVTFIACLLLALAATNSRTLCVSSDPSQDRLDRREAWIFRLAHYGEQLKPEPVVGALHKLANGFLR